MVLASGGGGHGRLFELSFPPFRSADSVAGDYKGLADGHRTAPASSMVRNATLRALDTNRNVVVSENQGS